MNLFAQFVYLQILDMLTTIAFMLQGVGEGNPLVRWAIRESPHPIGGLLFVKIIAVALAIFCMSRSRHALLNKVNVFFACLVAYNLVVLIISSPALQ